MLCGSNAAAVLISTTTFKIGPASMYDTQLDSGKPLRKSRRMTTTMPHSHIGNTNPNRPPTITAGRGERGMIFEIKSCGSSSSSSPAIRAPSTTNGIASQKIERNSSVKSETSWYTVGSRTCRNSGRGSRPRTGTTPAAGTLFIVARRRHGSRAGGNRDRRGGGLAPRRPHGAHG